MYNLAFCLAILGSTAIISERWEEWWTMADEGQKCWPREKMVCRKERVIQILLKKNLMKNLIDKEQIFIYLHMSYSNTLYTHINLRQPLNSDENSRKKIYKYYYINFFTYINDNINNFVDG